VLTTDNLQVFHFI
jgi:hypothetical protein